MPILKHELIVILRIIYITIEFCGSQFKGIQISISKYAVVTDEFNTERNRLK